MLILQLRFLGVPSDGVLIGSVALLVLAYVTRFQAIGYGAMSAGVERLSPNVMNASFVLGRGFSRTMGSLAPRLLRSSMMAAGLLVFVDVMKELPMTLLLRPFNFDTLSTYVYQFAKDELLEEATLAALAIVAAGLGPVILMNASQKKRSRSKSFRIKLENQTVLYAPPIYQRQTCRAFTCKAKKAGAAALFLVRLVPVETSTDVHHQW